MLSPVTSTDLRKELQTFAAVELRRELGSLKDDLLTELRESAALILCGTSPQAARHVEGDVSSTLWPASAPAGVRAKSLQWKSSRSRTLTSFDRDIFEAHSQSIKLFSSDDEMRPMLSQPSLAHGVPSVRAIVSSSFFQTFVSAAVLLNMLSFGCQVDWNARNWTESDPVVFLVLECIFCAVFLVEVLLRLCAFSMDFFCDSESWTWNAYDLVLVATQITELLMVMFQPERQDQSAIVSMRFLRLLRLTRVARLGRMLRLVPELRLLMVSIADSWKTLVWVLIVVLMANFAVAMVLTQTVTQHKQYVGEDGIQETALLDKYFGNLLTTTYHLYQVITEGLQWGELLEPLGDKFSPWVFIFFSIYAAFMILGMLNVVTSYFVETTMAVAREDYKVSMSKGLWDVFQETHFNDGRPITREEFNVGLNNKKLFRYLKTLELSPDDIRDSHFFDLIDQDHSGGVDLDELVHGCLYLTGPAKALDLAGLQYEFRNYVCQQLTENDIIKTCLGEIMFMLTKPKVGVGVEL